MQILDIIFQKTKDSSTYPAYGIACEWYLSLHFLRPMRNENPWYRNVHHTKRTHKIKLILPKPRRKSRELTPRMWYQSMKEGGLAGLERSLWTHATERVEIEQMSNTNWVLKSDDSCPILPIDESEKKERFWEFGKRNRGKRAKGLPIRIREWKWFGFVCYRILRERGSNSIGGAVKKKEQALRKKRFFESGSVGGSKQRGERERDSESQRA